MEPDPGKETVTNCGETLGLRCLWPSSRPFTVLLIPRTSRGSSAPSSKKQLSRSGMNLSLSLSHSLVPNPTAVQQPSLGGLNQTVGVSNPPREVTVSEPIPFNLGPLRDIAPFLRGSSTPILLLGWDFLEKYHAEISFSRKGEIILEFDSSQQNGQSGELNGSSTSLLCSSSKAR